LLLDTPAFAWWALDDPALTSAARSAILDESNDIFVSAVTAWEIASKFRRGQWPQIEAVATNLSTVIVRQAFYELPITITHAQRAGALPEPHRDPFDRILIAQALTDGMTIVSNERAFDSYGVARLW
jgi:PIN domain nuclease of toxin-antitoxin system